MSAISVPIKVEAWPDGRRLPYEWQYEEELARIFGEFTPSTVIRQYRGFDQMRPDILIIDGEAHIIAVIEVKAVTAGSRALAQIIHYWLAFDDAKPDGWIVMGILAAPSFSLPESAMDDYCGFFMPIRLDAYEVA